ncbi:MAG: hypothetical protein GY838_15575 [bacterium]|nr:hypothetical protein [bacterium]
MLPFIVPLLLASAVASATAVDDDVAVRGPYLGRPRPGAAPELFAPGIVSTATREWSLAATPDGREIFFGISSLAATAIVHTRETGNGWTPLEVAPFSGAHDDFDLTMSPDGNRLWFTSARPVVAEGEEPEFVDIWYVERKGDGWGDPVRPHEPVNSPARELYPTEAADGYVYFFSNRPGGFGGTDIYRTRFVPHGFAPPENLGPAVNTAAGESDLCVAADGSLLVFTSSREGGYGRGDLYVTFCTPDGGWTPARNLGPVVNTEYTEFCPSLSADGTLLFFTSNRLPGATAADRDGGLRRRLGVDLEGVPPNIDIYWMDASFMAELRPVGGM